MRVALDCPETEGKLLRLSQASDGKTCTYAGDDNAEIELRLVPVHGGVDATLKTVEDSLLPAPTEVEKTEAQANADASASSGGTGEEVDINIPGFRIHAKEDKAEIKIGSMTVDAGDEKAVIRSKEDVRLKGEPLSREKRGVRASYIHAADNLPGGYRYVGYQAAGPKAGPLAVASVRGKSEEKTLVMGVTDDDIKRLVRRNGGV